MVISVGFEQNHVLNRVQLVAELLKDYLLVVLLVGEIPMAHFLGISHNQHLCLSHLHESTLCYQTTYKDINLIFIVIINNNYIIDIIIDIIIEVFTLYSYLCRSQKTTIYGKSCNINKGTQLKVPFQCLFRSGNQTTSHLFLTFVHFPCLLSYLFVT